MIAQVLFALIYLAAGLVLVIGRSGLVRFLEETPSIRGAGAMERFKAMARSQMKLALAQAALLTTGMVVGLVLVVRSGLSGLLVVLAVNGLVIGLAFFNKKVETRVREVPTATDELAQEKERVIQTWEKKALPDF